MNNPAGNSRPQVAFGVPIDVEGFVPPFEISPAPKRLFCRDSGQTRKVSIPILRELGLLLVGDSTHDELLIINALHWGGFEIRHKRVQTMAGVEAALAANAWDLVICDYSLRETNGSAVLTQYRQMGLDIPFIMVSGTGEDLAVAVLKAGAHAYVTKQNLAPLVPAVNRELRAAREREIRRQIEAS